jgi:hypothetical protein
LRTRNLMPRERPPAFSHHLGARVQVPRGLRPPPAPPYRVSNPL